MRTAAQPAIIYLLGEQGLSSRCPVCRPPMQALAAITRLLACLDFHPSLLPAMCRAAAAARHPSVRKAAVSSAVQLLISPDAVASGLPHGREAQLLLELVRAISGCFQVVPSSVGTGCEVAGSGGASSGALYGELVAAVKLVAKRLKLLGWQAFAGAAADGVSVVGELAGMLQEGCGLCRWQCVTFANIKRPANPSLTCACLGCPLVCGAGRHHASHLRSGLQPTAGGTASRRTRACCGAGHCHFPAGVGCQPWPVWQLCRSGSSGRSTVEELCTILA